MARVCDLRPRSCLVPRIRRYTSLPPLPSTSLLQKSKTAAKVTGFLCLSSALGIVVVGTGILAHDAFIYNDRHVDRVPVNSLALHPDHCGPKNCPTLAMGVLQTLHPGDYHVILVSSDTYTTFTPLLPCELYDKLVIAVGSSSSTHGVSGLGNCFQLKTIGDAQSIRRRIMDNFEMASLPTTSAEERKRLLSFVICGGGPTGIETAAEIYDFCQEDIMNYFPKIRREEVSIHVIQSRDHILNTYSEKISKFAENKSARDEVDLITSARVAGITPTHVLYTTRNANGETEQHSIPSNFVLWSTGIAMNPFTQRVSSLLPNQVHKKAIEVDSHLRVNGAPKGEVYYAIGDCATIETSLLGHFLSLVGEADKNKDGKIDMGEWEYTVKELFRLYDSDADNSLTLNELFLLLQDVGNYITSLPATAQVAAQQGKYLGKLHKATRAAPGQHVTATDEQVSSPFKYLHLRTLTYIRNAAVFDFGKQSFIGGLVAMYAWRSIYWNEQVNSRTRALLMINWIIRGIWGHDLSRL
ncbi:hypothetical protein HYPSUDRAFT_65274 [Hypholoma sublateritium FD-334 SS-4]|uniref:EF-hand domain-containing protein n=1 Tax=Hypholoma sublateritium (strain FD-334 SS-4) TaxID=945553 RepID=A0A0D2MM34_HYPSF|nr:hypothetical protein HYPSUDRAFT_65274 [Hypholoma sublateritium FD-334 SS-4]